MKLTFKLNYHSFIKFTEEDLEMAEQNFEGECDVLD
jgi:hypothetical protein